MKFLPIVVICLLLSNLALAQFSIERTRNLGSGFRIETRAEPRSSSFESVGHFEYLFYGERKLCQVGQYSVDPSGKFAIYQDAASGILFLFRRADQRVFRLTPKPVGFPGTFLWYERGGTVEVRFEGNKTFTAFKLP